MLSYSFVLGRISWKQISSKISWNDLKFPERMCFPILLCRAEFPENKFLANFLKSGNFLKNHTSKNNILDWRTFRLHYGRPANFEKQKFIFWHPKIHILHKKFISFRNKILKLDFYQNICKTSWQQQLFFTLTCVFEWYQLNRSSLRTLH